MEDLKIGDIINLFGFSETAVSKKYGWLTISYLVEKWR